MTFIIIPRVVLTLADFNEPTFDTTNDLIKLHKIKQRLNETKSKLNETYKYPYASRVMRDFDAFSKEKYNIAIQANTCNVTIAWLKCYELLYKFNLISQKKEDYIYFDNAAFPGSFILATHHLICTKHPEIKNFQWVASSLLETINNNTPLNDSYNLYSNYPDNWLMHEHNNGDISQFNNIKNFQTQIKDKFLKNSISDKHQKIIRLVDLYSCDLGIGLDRSKLYNDQEQLHFHLNTCQIVCGLMTLKSGGNMICKHYTIFEPYTISYISLLTALFSTVYITKPSTSKRTNSELYIVCKDYQYPFKKKSVEMRIYNILTNCAKSYNTTNYQPLISSKYIQNQINAILYISDKIFGAQITALNNYLYLMTNYNNHNTRKWCYHKLYKVNSAIRNTLFSSLHIMPIDSRYKLNVTSIY